jgi:hypothetical protein
VSTVQFDAVEADALGVRGGFGKGADDVVQVTLGHRLTEALGAVEANTGGAHGGRVGVGCVALVADHADVPQLRHDRAACRVYVLGDLRPPRQRLFAVEPWHPITLPGGLVADVGALGDDQANAGGGAAAVVRPHVVTGNAVGGEHARHRRHHDAVGDGQAVQRDGSGKDLGCARGVGRGDDHWLLLGVRPMVENFKQWPHARG